MTSQKPSPAKPAQNPPPTNHRREDDDDEVLGKAYDQRIVERTWIFVHPYRIHLLWSLALMICIAIGNLAGPYLIKIAIDDAIANSNLTLLAVAAIGYVASSLLVWVATY
ncbi:MAG: ABC transporter ATP-binding protein, partial [Proteobacteria bacterium]|nr:ABC transporter ATP-binding protein [Pseudomonadota bacterium]